MNNLLYYDICAILVIAILMHIVYTRRNIEARTNHVLFVLMAVTAISAIGDLVAAIAENGTIHRDLAILLAYLANYVYFIAHPLIFPMFVLYIYASFDLWSVFRKNILSEVLWLVLVGIDFAILITNPFTNALFYITDDVEYCRGDLFYIIYVVAFIFAGWGIGIIVHHRAHASTLKLTVLLITFPLTFVAIIIQSLDSTKLVECFTIALQMLFFIIVIHRNENPVDPATGAMKYYRALERATVALDFKRPFAAIFIKIINFNNLKLYLGHDRVIEYLNLQSDMIRDLAIKENYLLDTYYLENGSYALFCDDNDKSKALSFAKKIYELSSVEKTVDSLKIMPEIAVCVAECPVDIDDIRTLLTVSTSFANSLPPGMNLIDYSEYKDTKEFKIRNNINAIIERGLKDKRFEMYYQPIYSTTENRFISAEALIRLRDEEYGYISPALFIPAAEESGAIHEIGDFVFRDVFRFISENNIADIGLKYIEVNISASQCVEVDLVDRIDALLKHYNISPSQISMELTEVATDINPAIVDQNVKKMHNLGIRFALDDYGTGYSNIRRVTSLPFDQVKLDKSFVDNIDNPVMWNVIKDTIQMFREMGKEILVEGIEDEKVIEKISEIRTDLIQGCELFQGFYFCRPMPESEFMGYMKARMAKFKKGSEN